jgi:Mn2+/Fe2+ NRAMP family transporter
VNGGGAAGSRRARMPLIAMIGPGLLLAATGVGSGDLATASIAGGLLGTAVLWAVLVGAFLKFVVTEGLARWQLGSGETLLEGAARCLGRIAIWLFLPYLVLWSFFVGSAQMSANGVTLHALIPLFEDAETGKIVFGVLTSVIGLALVLRGGYVLFEKVMRVCISIMFVTVVVTAALLWPGFGPVLSGLLIPQVPDVHPEAAVWTIALLGGVGGTLTVLCYGYWMREEGRTTPEDLFVCRVDLGLSYLMAAVFGIAMVIIGTRIELDGEGTRLLVMLSNQLGEELGPAGRWLFLIGTFGAVFSSLLGVWQAVPYLFADCWRLLRRERAGPDDVVDTRAAPYRVFLVLLALVPMAGLLVSFREIQKLYTVIGAWFFPLLALALLVFNGAWASRELRNRPATMVVLVAVLGLFIWIALADHGG